MTKDKLDTRGHKMVSGVDFKFLQIEVIREIKKQERYLQVGSA